MGTTRPPNSRDAGTSATRGCPTNSSSSGDRRQSPDSRWDWPRPPNLSPPESTPSARFPPHSSTILVGVLVLTRALSRRGRRLVSPVPGSGVYPQKRKEANPASSVLQQRTADSSRPGCSRQRRGWLLADGCRGQSRRCALASWLPARLVPPGSAVQRTFRQFPVLCPELRARSQSISKRGGREGRERGGGAYAGPGAGPRGEGGRHGRVTHTPSNQE